MNEITPDLMDFYEDDNYPDIIQESYGWPSRNIGAAESFVQHLRPGHVWRCQSPQDVPSLISEAMRRLSDFDQTLKFIVELNNNTGDVDLKFVGPSHAIIPLHAAGAQNLPFALNYYQGKRVSLTLQASTQGVFWVSE